MVIKKKARTRDRRPAGILLAAVAGMIAAAIPAETGPAWAGAKEAAMSASAEKAVPVILDTDIGDDIDDTWALVMLLRSPQLDLKLVTTTYGKAEYRAKLVARLLTVAGRTDVPVGLGAGGREGTGKQAAWVKDYDLRSYAGRICQDGVQALIDAVNSSKRPVTIISIGPSNTVAEALKRDPGIAAKAYFTGMHGSIRKGYDSGPVSAEWNVKASVEAARTALLAPWKRTLITPLDTCGLVRLAGPEFRTVRDCPNPLVKALMENYRIWSGKGSVAELTESSVLFDTVAVYLALPGSKTFLTIEDLKLGIGGDGITRVAPDGAPISAAVEWTDIAGYRAFLVGRLAKTAKVL